MGFLKLFGQWNVFVCIFLHLIQYEQHSSYRLVILFPPGASRVEKWYGLL